MNTVCKEHEFIEVELSVTGDSKIVYSTLCRKCGKEKLPIDFKVKEICKEHESEYEPYFGWCDVDGCENEGCGGGFAWRETGYWTVCSKHSSDNRIGKPQPKMKQSAIDREKSRDVVTGYLPSPKQIDFHIKDNIEVVEKQEWEDIKDEWVKSKEFDFDYEFVFEWLSKNYLAPEKK